MVPMTVFNKLETDHNLTKSLFQEKSRLIDKLNNQLKALSNNMWETSEVEEDVVAKGGEMCSVVVAMELFYG